MDVKKRKIEVEEYYIKCKICKTEIKGRSETQTSFNYGLHLDSHKKKDKKEDDKKNGKKEI